MNKQEISDLLYKELSNIYCYNCRGNNEVTKNPNNDDDFCEDCYRKYMGWAISRKECDKLADEILK